jgi:hypothetical protein
MADYVVGRAYPVQVSSKTNYQGAATVIVSNAESERLRIALNDAINSPKGVVPDSAVEFYDYKSGKVHKME